MWSHISVCPVCVKTTCCLAFALGPLTFSFYFSGFVISTLPPNDIVSVAFTLHTFLSTSLSNRFYRNLILFPLLYYLLILLKSNTFGPWQKVNFYRTRLRVKLYSFSEWHFSPHGYTRSLVLVLCIHSVHAGNSSTRNHRGRQWAALFKSENKS